MKNAYLFIIFGVIHCFSSESVKAGSSSSRHTTSLQGGGGATVNGSNPNCGHVENGVMISCDQSAVVANAGA